jgi:putrescine transport system permease protein
MKIYSQVRLGVTPEINAISTILIGVVTIGVLTAAYFTKRQTERQELERRRAFGATG